MLDQAATFTASSPPLIPQNWLRHGIFDHAAHQRMSCKHCHAAIYENKPGPPDDNQRVMIDNIESCVDCHRDAKKPVKTVENVLFGDQPTWASDSCTLCHRYHSPISKRLMAESDSMVAP